MSEGRDHTGEAEDEVTPERFVSGVLREFLQRFRVTKPGID